MMCFLLVALTVVAVSVNAESLFQCGFETSSLCGMSYDTISDYTWTRKYYSTRTYGTGPGRAQSGFYYMYYEADYKSYGDKSYLRTPTLDYNGQICLSFYYNMKDTSRRQMGTLNVFSSSKGEQCPLLKLTGHQSNYWLKVNMETEIIAGDRIVFLGIRGNGTRGDMAVDTISIKTGSCSGIVVPPVCTSFNKTAAVPISITLIISAEKQRYRYSYYGYSEKMQIIKSIEGEPSQWVPQIGKTPLKNVTRKTIRNINKLGVNYPARSIVWSEPDFGSVSYGTIDSDVSDIFIATSTAHYFASPMIGALAVDWAAKNLYWTDRVYQWVMMTRLQNGTDDYYTVIDSDIGDPSGICVHPAKSFLFWSDISKTKPKIERTDLLGRQRLQIVNTTLKSPIVLDIDFTKDRLYWVDTGSYIIESCLLDGKDRKVVLPATHYVSKFVGMTIYQNYIFTVNNGKQLYIMDLRKSHQTPMNVTMDYDKALDIVAFGKHKQTNMTSPCSNIKCEGICVGINNNNNATCICPEGKQIYNEISCISSYYYYSPVYAVVTSQSVCLLDVFTPETNNPSKNRRYYSLNCDQQIYMYGIYGTVQSIGHLFSDKILYLGTDRDIYMVSMRPLAIPYLLISGAGNVLSISVDWIAKNIYWLDASGSIKVATYRGKHRAVLFNATGANSMVVDPTTGHMYWTDPKKKAIFQGDMAGSNKVVTIIDSLHHPGNITIDIRDKRLYWTDSAESQIHSIKTDKTHLMTIASSSPPLSIAIFRNHIAWTTPSRVNWVFKQSPSMKNGSRHSERGWNSGPILLYGEYSQPSDYANKCAEKAVCSHMCLSSTKNVVTCLCGAGFVLAADKKSCVRENIGQPDIILTTIAEHKILSLNVRTNKVVPLPLINVLQPSFVGVDISENVFFWLDIASKAISKATLMGQQQSTVWIFPEGQTPSGLAIDPIRKLVFYGLFNRSISSVGYDGQNSKVIIWSFNEEGPLSLSLDVTKRMIFWSNYGKFPGITMATYDGFGKRTLVDGLNIMYPTGLAFDAKQQLLYWCDSWIGRVESISTDGQKRTLLHYNPHAYYVGLTLLGNYIYIIDQNSSYIKQIPKTGGSAISNLGNALLPLGSGIVASGDPGTDIGFGTTMSVPQGKPEMNPSVRKEEDKNLMKHVIIPATVVPVVFLIIVVVVVACCLRSSGFLDKVKMRRSRLDHIETSSMDTSVTTHTDLSN